LYTIIIIQIKHQYIQYTTQRREKRSVNSDDAVHVYLYYYTRCVECRPTNEEPLCFTQLKACRLWEWSWKNKNMKRNSVRGGTKHLKKLYIINIVIPPFLVNTALPNVYTDYYYRLFYTVFHSDCNIIITYRT